MRRAGVAVALAVMLGWPAAATSQPAARLQGTFAMNGVVTKAHNIYGEHPGQSVKRSWTFTPECAVGNCEQVELQRQRSGERTLDPLVLNSTGPDTYSGRGRFWVPVRCAGHVVAHGGIANEEITVRITQTAIVGSTSFVTAIAAKYKNPRRLNLTGCPGGIGHDAARYQGRLTGAP